MRARNPVVTEETRKLIARLQAFGWYHSIELPGGEVTPGLQTIDQLRLRARQFPIPDDLRGKRVLDIGAWDGWFSFEMERRGATVVAVDAVRSEKFLHAREVLGSKVEYHVSDVYDLRPSELGIFDIVLFLGVLYHLKNPVLALERVCALSRHLVCVESFVTDDGSDPDAKPSMEFYETTELCGQFDNWVGPNVACLLGFCRTAGFASVSLESVLDDRAHVTCYRNWPASEGIGPAPHIMSFDNATSHDLVFSAAKDEYVALWFKSERAGLTEKDVFPEAGEFGAHPVVIHNVGGDGWLAVFKLPPGITPGWTPVRLRVRDSAYSNTVRLGIDVSEGELRERARTSGDVPDFKIEGATDGKTWEPNLVRIGPDACVSLWVSGIPANSSTEEIFVRIDGRELPSVFVSEPDSRGLRQVNALLPAGLALGAADVNVATRNSTTAPVRIEITR
ncbi:MAG TPA: methyltransferase domain-containing protein [Bryobacteraceae bacterium]|jgi:tRNA (mo5U34)-methyltransferase|nr:methyltransferase domain-containing protein [Bryobacteraceae bacterium]